MIVANKMKSDETRLIESALGRDFPTVEAYRYNSASIRVRIVDKRFAGKSRSERDEMVLALVRQLPEEIQMDITVLLLLAPDETEYSVMNVEFEHPSPSTL